MARRPGRFPLFDGLRAIAALSVVAVHFAAYTSSLNTGAVRAVTSQLAAGVCVFFLISGFLLYRPFVAARLERGSRDLPSYARGRVLRIVPAYWFALTVLALWPGLPGVFTRDAWVYYLFGQNYSVHTFGHGISPAWSLGTEVTFYAVLPVYAWLLSRPRFARRVGRSELVGLSVLFAGSWLFRGLAGDYTLGHNWVGQTLGGTFDWFALGMGAAVVSCLRPRLRIRPLAPLLAAAACIFAAAVWTYHSPNADQYSAGPIHILWAGAALGLLLPVAFAAPRTGFAALLSSRVMVQLGVVSYGIYLWHLPLIIEAHTLSLHHPGIPPVLLRLAAVAVAVAAAFVSYYALERPALALKRRRREPIAEATPVAA